MLLSLQHRVFSVLWLQRIGLGVLLLSGAYLHPALMAPGLLWLLCSEPWIRRGILPYIFRTFVCYRCHERQSLKGIWRCGDHFTCSESCHFLKFWCPHGHKLNQFDCPNCGATIVVLHRFSKYYKAGKAIELESLLPVAKNAPTSGIHIGDDPEQLPVLLPHKHLGSHVFVNGASGTGKSNLLGALGLNCIKAGFGLSLWDPGGDLCEKLRQRVPDERQGDIIYGNLLDPAFPLDLDILHYQDEHERADVVAEVRSVLHRIYADAWGKNINHVLLMALLAATEQKGNLQDLYDLCSDAKFRKNLPRVCPTHGSKRSGHARRRRLAPAPSAQSAAC